MAVILSHLVSAARRIGRNQPTGGPDRVTNLVLVSCEAVDNDPPEVPRLLEASRNRPATDDPATTIGGSSPLFRESPTVEAGSNRPYCSSRLRGVGNGWQTGLRRFAAKRLASQATLTGPADSRRAARRPARHLRRQEPQSPCGSPRCEVARPRSRRCGHQSRSRHATT